MQQNCVTRTENSKVPDLCSLNTVTMIHHVKSKEEFDEILKGSGDKLVVVDFTASWCGPCRAMAPLFEGASQDPANKNVVFLKVDVDEVQAVASEYRVRSVPTLLFFKNGELVESQVGAVPAAVLNNHLARYSGN